MSSRTEYFCDICSKEIEHKDLRKIKIGFDFEPNYHVLDICDDCYKHAKKSVGLVSCESFERKGFIEIFKRWITRKEKNTDEAR